MTTMMRWDPFQDLRSAQDEMAQMSPMLAHALGLHGQQQGSAAATAWAPALDISERKDAYLVTVELPGVEADDLQVTLEDGLLTIRGERHFDHDSSEQQFHRVERRYGAFRRSISLPAHVMAERIEASADIRITNPRYIDAGQTVVCTFAVAGTHDGPLGPFPATGNEFTLPLCEMWHFNSNWRVVGGDLSYDQVSLLTQLGLMPQPSGA